jgi:hypothetical protein
MSEGVVAESDFKLGAQLASLKGSGAVLRLLWKLKVAF